MPPRNGNDGDDHHDGHGGYGGPGNTSASSTPSTTAPSTTQTSQPGNHGNGDHGQHVPPPRPMPEPDGGYGHHNDPPWMNDHPRPFPDWEPVNDHNPWPGRHDDHDGDGHQTLPPPVVPNVPWRDPWVNQCQQGGHGNGGCQPRPNFTVWFSSGPSGQALFINAAGPGQNVNVYLTNSVTGEVRFYADINSGTPWSLPRDFGAGNWQWSAGYGNTLYGSGAFNIAVNGGYNPCRSDHALTIWYNGYTPYVVPANDWYLVPDTNYLYAQGQYYYYDQQPQLTTVPGQAEQQYVVQPVGWTPSPIVEAPQQGPPPQYIPFHTGRSPLPYILVGVVVLAVAGTAGIGAYQGWFSRGNHSAAAV